VERIFGIAKRKFKILTKAPEYDFPTQVKIVLALTALHNFIAIRDQHTDHEFDDVEEYYDECWTSESPLTVTSQSTTTRDQMIALRDSIANQMWSDYVEILHSRGHQI
jgi:hypothetical protein